DCFLGRGEDDYRVAGADPRGTAGGGEAELPFGRDCEQRKPVRPGVAAAWGVAADLDAGARAKAPVELRERESAVAEDAGLSRRRQQVRRLRVGSDPIDVTVAELVAKLRRAERVEVVAARQQQGIRHLLELGF